MFINIVNTDKYIPSWRFYGAPPQGVSGGRGKNHDQPRNLRIYDRQKGIFGKLIYGVLYLSFHSLKRIAGKRGEGPHTLAVEDRTPDSWCSQG